jgi:hypothetical protein
MEFIMEFSSAAFIAVTSETQTELDNMVYLFPDDFQQFALDKLQRWRNGDKSDDKPGHGISSYSGYPKYDCGWVLESFSPQNNCFFQWDDDGTIIAAHVSTADERIIQKVLDSAPKVIKDNLYYTIKYGNFTIDNEGKGKYRFYKPSFCFEVTLDSTTRKILSAELYRASVVLEA